MVEEGKSEYKGKKFTKEFLRKWSKTVDSEEEKLRTDEALLDRQDELLTRDPTNPDLWLSRGVLLSKLGRYEEAIDSFDRVIELAPFHKSVWNMKAYILREMGRTEEAALCFQKALKIATDETMRRVREPQITDEEIDRAIDSLVAESVKEQEIFEELKSLVEGLQKKPKEIWEEELLEPLEVKLKEEELIPSLVKGLEEEMKITAGIELVHKFPARGFVNGLRSFRSFGRPGYTNGLTNGSSFVNGLEAKRGLARRVTRDKWKLIVVSILIFGLVFAPIASYMLFKYEPRGIFIDGNFKDWTNVPKLSSKAGPPSMNRNIDIINYSMERSENMLSFYLNVRGTILEGSPPPLNRTDTFHIFIDTDNNVSTGYTIYGIGADYLIEIYGRNGEVASSLCYKFDVNQNRNCWNGWIQSIGIGTAVDETQLETQVAFYSLDIKSAENVVAYFESKGWDGSEDFSDSLIGIGKQVLQVTQRGIANPVIHKTLNANLLSIGLKAIGSDVSVSSMNITRTGNISDDSISSVYLLDEKSLVISEGTFSNGIATLSFSQPLKIANSETANLTLSADLKASAPDNSTLGAIISERKDIRTMSGIISLTTQPHEDGFADLGYVGNVPSEIVVDGAFADWEGKTTPESIDEVSDKNIEIERFGVNVSSTDLSFYLNVDGKMMGGTSVPFNNNAQWPVYPSTSLPSIPDADRDTIPDELDPMPYDFNNDGTNDTDTGYDYDNDNILDYPGPDYWLNTTIPNNSTFPEQYRNKSVSVYIGPANVPVVKGEDIVRIFIDNDSLPSTGLRIDDLGADYLIQISGKDGQIIESNYYKYDGHGNWTDKKYLKSKIDTTQLEAQIASNGISLVNGFKVYFQTTDWKYESDYSLSLEQTRASLPVEIQASTISHFEDEHTEANLFRKVDNGYLYSLGDNESTIFASDNKSEIRYELTKGENAYTIDYQTLRLSYRNALSEEEVIQVSETAVSKLNGLEVEYLNHLENVTEEFRIDQTKLKHNINISAMPRDTYLNSQEELKLAVVGNLFISPTLKIYADGFARKVNFTISNQIELRNENNETIFYIPAPIVIDSSRKEFACSYGLRYLENRIEFSVQVDYDSVESMAFPISIDPTIVGSSNYVLATAYSTMRHVVKTTDGTLGVFYRGNITDTSSTQGIVYRTSIDNGVSWSAPTLVTPKNNNFPSVVIDSSNTVYIVYSTDESSSWGLIENVCFKRLTYNAVARNWTVPPSEQIIQTSSASNAYYYAVITIATNGSLWCVYTHKYVEGVSSYYFYIRMKWSIDGGTTWQPTTGTSLTADYYTIMPSSYWATITALTNNKLYEVANLGGTCYGKRFDGSTWEATGRFVATVNTYDYPSIVSNSADSVFFTYQNNGIRFKKYTYSNNSWWGDRAVDTSSTGHTRPVISIDNGNRLYVVYSKWFASSPENRYSVAYKISTDGGNTWSTTPSYLSVFNKVWIYDNSLGSFTDETEDSGDSDVGDVPFAEEWYDRVYLGHDWKFGGAYFDLSTVASSSILPEYRYWNGSGWAILTLSQDTVNGFRQSGHITFVPPSDWSKCVVNSTDKYWISFRRTNSSSIAVTPIASIIVPLSYYAYPSTIYKDSTRIHVIWTNAPSGSSTSNKIEYNYILCPIPEYKNIWLPGCIAIIIPIYFWRKRKKIA